MPGLRTDGAGFMARDGRGSLAMIEYTRKIVNGCEVRTLTISRPALVGFAVMIGFIILCAKGAQ